MAYILVADDDEILAEMVRYRLTKVGHEVRTVEDGQQLLDQVALRTPDTILLDAIMPVRSGMEHPDAAGADPTWPACFNSPP